MLGGGATAATINGEKFLAIRMLPDKNLMHMRSPSQEKLEYNKINGIQTRSR